MPVFVFVFLEKTYGKMESRTKTSNKESLKRAQRRCNNRKKETAEEANNQKKKMLKKWQKSENWTLQKKQIIGRK